MFFYETSMYNPESIGEILKLSGADRKTVRYLQVEDLHYGDKFGLEYAIMTVSQFLWHLEYDARSWLGMDTWEYYDEDPFEDDDGKEWLQDMTGETSFKDLKKIISNNEFLFVTHSYVICSVNYQGWNLIVWFNFCWI